MLIKSFYGRFINALTGEQGRPKPLTSLPSKHHHNSNLSINKIFINLEHRFAGNEKYHVENIHVSLQPLFTFVMSIDKAFVNMTSQQCSLLILWEYYVSNGKSGTEQARILMLS